MIKKKSKERSFDQFARRYWEKFVNGILVPGERGCVPSEGETLSVYNELKERHPECDELIYFTDGYAPPPVFNTKRPIDVLWVICSRQCYAENSTWIRKIKRNRVTFIPRSE
ncbi:hypothetical protein [Fibrobacter sp.]|uniref:hypothetical protein n=1 Tax=Fibrobacter sp. TaxID=35828 RepID=UPI00388FF9BF